MAILQKTREKAGMAVSIIIALALLSFIIDPQTLETAFNAMSSRNDVGEINGKTVSYLDFQQDVEKFTTINEMVTGSSAQTEQQQEQIRNAAWQSLLDKYLFIKNAKAAGIRVGEEEMKDLLAGDMISPVISQNPAFRMRTEISPRKPCRISSTESHRIRPAGSESIGTIFRTLFTLSSSMPSTVHCSPRGISRILLCSKEPSLRTTTLPMLIS